jgi:hypothetical protein
MSNVVDEMGGHMGDGSEIEEAMTNKTTPDDDWLENTLKELWLEFYNNSTLTAMSDTYYIAQVEAKAAINAKITELLVATRLNELKHRADDIIGRMYRIDRGYADSYVSQLQASHPINGVEE